MSATPIRVLFVCTHNSARSIMAEALLRERGGGDFEAVSAGVEPGEVRPLTLRVLLEAALPTEGLYSKPVRDFLGQPFDHVITVCDAARQSCPVIPGSHQSLHWGFEDPAAAEGSEEERLVVYRRVFAQIDARVTELVATARSAGAGEPNARAGEPALR